MSKELSHLNTLKDAFTASYLQLLHDYSPNQITVKQIVEKANASRSTFYTYYESREHLHVYVKELLQGKLLMFYEKEEHEIHKETTTSELCQHIIKYRAYYQFAFSDANEIQYMSKALSERLIEVYNDKDYAIFASYGTIGYLKNWVEEGFLISPAEASEKLLKIGFTDWTRDLRKRIVNEFPQ